MSEAKHTPGPWHQGTELTQIEGIDGTIVCHVSGAPSNESVIADARLIAAAPELLEALQASEKALSEALTLLMNSGLVSVDTGEGELMDVEGAVGRIDAAIDSARKAVTTATGEQK